MKNLILTSILTLLFNLTSLSQGKINKSEMMEDSLWRSLSKFCSVTKKYLDKEKVTQSDVDNFLKYVFQHMKDTVQSSTFWLPKDYSKKEAMGLLVDQTRDLINKKCTFKFISWDGWDGKTPCTGFDFDIHHDGYRDQFLMIVDTKDNIYCIFSSNSIL
jgi:hypothetical protein